MAGLYDCIADGRVKREDLSGCVEFVINDASLFSEMGINTLRSEPNSGFLKCSRSLSNDCECVRYYPDYKRLRSVLGLLKPENFIQCLVNLKSLFDTKNFDVINGFFNKNNVAIRFNDVYVDLNTSRVYIIYVPLISSNYENTCDSILTEEILSAVQSFGNLESEITTELCDLLRAKKPPFEAIAEISRKYGHKPVDYEAVSAVTSLRSDDEPPRSQSPRLEPPRSQPPRPEPPRSQPPRPEPPRSQPQKTEPQRPQPPKPCWNTELIENTGLYLISEKKNVEFPLKYGPNVIGYNKDVDIDLIALNRDVTSHTVSGNHATLYVGMNGSITIEDHSRNGTFILSKSLFGKEKNLERLTPKMKYPVKVGTYLVFADEEMKIVKKKIRNV